MPISFSNAVKAKVAKREVAQRRRVYPRLVDSGKMTANDAQFQIDVMESIAADYADRAEAESQAAAPTLL